MIISRVATRVNRFETWNAMVRMTEMMTAPPSASRLQRAPVRRNKPAQLLPSFSQRQPAEVGAVDEQQIEGKHH